MKKLKIAVSEIFGKSLPFERETIDVNIADLTEVSAIVLSVQDVREGILQQISRSQFNIPVFVDVMEKANISANTSCEFLDFKQFSSDEIAHKVETAAQKYEDALLPPFFDRLVRYVDKQNLQFDCPGHQGGDFFKRHPAGRAFFDFYGEAIFRSDLCNADVALGDLLIHEGPPNLAQQAAAKVFNADKTYFVLNGTSSANKVVLNAVLTPGDLVLFDRNNHKSNHHGAFLQAGATPVYLETARNPYGFIGGIDLHCFNEDYLRGLVREVAPDKANQARPFRLAVIQLGTYDGTIYNARQVVDTIGHLCDYILFDSAWVGYEQFIPMMKDCSPLLLELGPEDPGIFVTQSVHKQQAGFSQTSQIHKKDSHIRNQSRYVPHKRVNNAFMLHASTSPFYPLFAALDVNAMMHKGELGQRLWLDCVRVGIEARKLILKHCRYIRPFVPPLVDGKPWESFDTNEMINSLKFFDFEPGQKWHAFENYGPKQYFVDPCKLLLTTPGIDVNTGEYDHFGVPATVLANFLRGQNVIPEKCDLNSILFLLTPAESIHKMEKLVEKLVEFENLLDADAPLDQVLPELYRQYEGRYKGYTIRRLCQEMHDTCRKHNVKLRLKNMFRREHFPQVAMLPQAAHYEYIRGNVDFIPLQKAKGRVAAEGALPYPPGIICCVPGEVWGDAVLEYYLGIEETLNLYPGFTPELQGVYLQKDSSGQSRIYCYVLRE